MASLARTFGWPSASRLARTLLITYRSELLALVRLHASVVSRQLASAMLIGIDLGPNLSVTGLAAMILWLIALRREKVEITAWSFFKVGTIAMPAALVLAVLSIAEVSAQRTSINHERLLNGAERTGD